MDIEKQTISETDKAAWVQTPSTHHYVENRAGKSAICNVPEGLVREFMWTVVWRARKYPDGINEALQDLMRKDVQKQKKLDSTPQP